MFARKLLPVGTIVMVLLVAMSTMALAYGHWTKTLEVNGTVNTGSFDAAFFNVFTDDDGDAYVAGYDDTDLGLCAVGLGSCDPKTGGKNSARYDKAVGACAAWIDPTTKKLVFQLDNVYPGYYCTVFVKVQNTGEIPWKFAGERYHTPGELEVTWMANSPTCGDQVDAGQLSDMAGLIINVKQSAQPDSTYTGWYQFDMVNWNEWNVDMCTSTGY